MLTTTSTSTTCEDSNVASFICYYCDDVIGTIFDIKHHFSAEHTEAAAASEAEIDSLFKVKRVQDGKKPVTGYLECQICGYLSPGFDRSKQRVHFHDEHPLEQSINCSKYVSKVKATANVASVKSTEFVFDPIKYIGMVMKCPKEGA